MNERTVVYTGLVICLIFGCLVLGHCNRDAYGQSTEEPIMGNVTSSIVDYVRSHTLKGLKIINTAAKNRMDEATYNLWLGDIKVEMGLDDIPSGLTQEQASVLKTTREVWEGAGIMNAETLLTGFKNQVEWPPEQE